MTTTQAQQNVLVLPASAAQQRFWIADQLKPGDPALNVAVRFLLEGTLDVQVLHRALQQIIARHEILRANFRMLDGRISQIVEDDREIELPLTDLSFLEGQEQNDAADRYADLIASEPFHLSVDPLLRAHLLRLSAASHVLLVTLHHIVCDGWSIGIFTDELGACYEAMVQERSPELPDLPVQYADFTMWQQENTAVLAKSEAYWLEQLRTAAPPEPAGDFPRTGATANASFIVSRLLPESLTHQLSALGQRHESTSFMTVIAGFSALLSRYTGLEDITIASQAAGRDQAEVEPLIGPFVNTIPLRLNTSGDPQYTELLKRTSETVSSALAHAAVPFDRIVELLRVKREAGRNPVTDISFIHQRDFVHPWQRAGVRLTPIPSRSPGAIYDLNFFMVGRAEGWRVSCEYNIALYKRETVEQMLEHLEELLTSVAANPQQRVSEIEFMGAAERSKLLQEWNNTHTSYPFDSRIHDLLTHTAACNPSKVAAICGGETIDYATLERRSNQLARYLAARGAARETVIGLCLNRSINMLVAILAVLKTGAAYLPIDPSLPAERLTLLAGDSGMNLLVTERALSNTIAAEVPAVCLDGERKAIDGESGVTFDGGARPQDVAYVLYTSGSTGTPKGVEVPHRAVVNLLHAFQGIFRPSEGDVLVATTTLSFDIAALELFAPLLTGSRLVIATNIEAQDPMQLRNLLYRSGATIFQATPVRYRMLLEAGWRNMPRLKMLCGGEKLTRELADQLLARGLELWNVYGPTETTVWSSVARIEKNEEAITVGKPIANTSFYILDNRFRPVPVGVAGELYIGGDGVACGYRNRPQLTAERFLNNPFAAGKIYRTGDRARYWHDGRVELLGRNDDQVKVRGYRIELGEVEAALARCPGVASAAVTLCQDASGEAALAGYWVSPAVDVPQMRVFLQSQLPHYMVPTLLTRLDTMPLTGSGKIDRRQLPEPSKLVPVSAPVDSEIASAPPETTVDGDPLEAALTEIWESVLGHHPIRPTDDFFELGGHSVMAAQMFARMERQIGQALPLATLFQAPTIRRLAALMRDKNWAPSWSTLVPIRNQGTRKPLFLIHPIGGNIVNFKGFCAHFGEDQPIYGLQARGLDGKETPRTSIEEMARDYISEIRGVQAQGPYAIGGFSAGGVVAFEMARQLQAEGETVATLALLDSKINAGQQASSTGSSTIQFARFASTAKANARYAMRMSAGAFLKRKAKNLKMRAAVRMAQIKSALHIASPASHLGAEEGFILALRRYVPRPYTGDAVLFVANEQPGMGSGNLGWDQLVRGTLHIEELIGDHDALMQEPCIGELVELLKAHMERAQKPAIRYRTPGNSRTPRERTATLPVAS